MTHAGPDDLDSILTADVVDESDATIVDRRPTLPSAIEAAVTQYAESMERLLGGGVNDDPYTRGFVAGLRAAAKVAASVVGT
jgi:hypothetical protein